MTADETQIAIAAMTLSPEARAALAEQLLDSLEAGTEQRATDAAWETEIKARLAAYEAGAAETIPAAEVFRGLGLNED